MTSRSVGAVERSCISTQGAFVLAEKTDSDMKCSCFLSVGLKIFTEKRVTNAPFSCQISPRPHIVMKA